MTIGENLFEGPPATLLPVDPAAAELAAGIPAEQVVRDHPTSSLAWVVLSDEAWVRGSVVESYAYARVGYHRGLDALRRNDSIAFRTTRNEQAASYAGIPAKWVRMRAYLFSALTATLERMPHGVRRAGSFSGEGNPWKVLEEAKKIFQK